ncbi:MAG: hypothetical protein HZA28_03715 [Candidatus Omnitrophica bacterium]|nr:hypothetical protein [Candidatus Omnitrophota bacterium]
MAQLVYRICLAVALAGSVAVRAGAQETKDLQAAFGSVVKASASEVVISQYNSEQETDQEVTYAVDPQTHLEGVTAAGEFVAGEEVEILYEEVAGTKMARFISRELLPEEDMQADDIGNAEDMPANATSEDL